MKKIFKYGVGVLLPLTLVAGVLSWIYNIFVNLTRTILPNSMVYAWWYPFVVIIGIVILVFIIGLLISKIPILRWIKKQFEKLFERIPIIGKIYSFGKNISDSFITDIKEDGDLQVIEISFGEFKMLGVLTDERNKLGFILSAPSPLTGIVMKLPNFRKLDITFIDAVQINTSLGRINGSKWK